MRTAKTLIKLSGCAQVILLVLSCCSLFGLMLHCRQERDRIVLATKVRFQMDNSNVNKIGLSRRHLVESCEESLKRLKTHFIDLYQVRERLIFISRGLLDFKLPRKL